MATQNPTLECVQCGARIAPDRRYCLQCYAPVGAASSKAHIELARKTETTHRPDPTRVFSPEKHEALTRRARTRKRAVVLAAVLVTTAVAGLVTLNAMNQHKRAVEKAMARGEAGRRDLDALADALERFRIDVRRYPTNEEGLRCLERKPAAVDQESGNNQSAWFGPYLEHPPEVDPWGNDYVYRSADGGRSFELFSDGPSETGSYSGLRVTSRIDATQQ